MQVFLLIGNFAYCVVEWYYGGLVNAPAVVWDSLFYLAVAIRFQISVCSDYLQ